MKPIEVEDKSQEELFQEVLKHFSRLIKNHSPERIEEIRDALKFSATHLVSNRPESVNDFRKLAGEMDGFLLACKTGEIDPTGLLDEDFEEEE